jgi:aryl-alcohol dehydrogenase-like predicted oxidoreductase
MPGIAQIALGKQGMQSSRMGLGCMSIGLTMGSKDLYGKRALTQAQVDALIAKALEVGCTHLDTAQIYKSAVLLLTPPWMEWFWTTLFGARFSESLLSRSSAKGSGSRASATSRWLACR